MDPIIIVGLFSLLGTFSGTTITYFLTVRPNQVRQSKEKKEKLFDLLSDSVEIILDLDENIVIEKQELNAQLLEYQAIKLGNYLELYLGNKNEKLFRYVKALMIANRELAENVNAYKLDNIDYNSLKLKYSALKITAQRLYVDISGFIIDN
ncbi:MAG: hypothetical protein HeimC2_14370 [Candidatus Heimdallarchaeota archaeon LC_2]|nr:MAG: hypothetical protein HeimC2_14370 [Candidatus Heimdallarchaeota archaeon LC_2]